MAVPMAGGSIAIGYSVADDAIGDVDILNAHAAPTISLRVVGIENSFHLTSQGIASLLD